MAAVSLSLLSGGKKDIGNISEEAPTEETVAVDIDSMTLVQIDALVVEHKIAVPGNWKKCSLTAKVKWLKDNLPSTPEEEVVENAAEVSAEAAAPSDPVSAPAADPTTADVHTAVSPEAVDAQLSADAVTQENIGEGIQAIAAAVLPAKGLPIEATAKGKKGSKSKALAKSDVKSGEILSADPIVDIIHEIENLNEKGVYASIEALKDQSAISFFKLGGVFSVAQANGWFDGYANLKEFAESKYGIAYRNATYWVSIYNNLAESKVPWEKVKGIGWTKLKEIAKILTIENVDEWVQIASENNTLQLEEIVKTHKKKLAGQGALEDESAKTVTTKTFKMHDGQRQVIEAAIEKAKEAAGTKVDTVALEAISQEYLASPTMQSRLKTLGLEAAAELFEKAFPLATITIELIDAPSGEGTQAA